MLAEVADLQRRNAHLAEQVDGLKAQVQNIAKAHSQARIRSKLENGVLWMHKRQSVCVPCIPEPCNSDIAGYKF